MTSTNAFGRVTADVFDLLDRLTRETDPLARTAAATYDLAGDETGSTDPAGLAEHTAYDADRRPVVGKDARGLPTYTTYDANGNVVATTDAAGKTTDYFYDGDNRPTGTLDPDGFTTSTAYDLVGNVTATTDERGRTTDYYYDALNRQVGVLDPDGNLSETAYDAVGNVVQTADPRGDVTRTLYDGDSRPIAVQDPSGAVRTAAYDAVGNVVRTVDGNGKVTLTSYDAMNRPYLTQDPDGQLSLTVYNAAGDAVATADGAGDLTQTAYDGDDEATATRNPDGFVSGTTYTPDGQVASVTDPDGNTTRYVYDGDGNQVAAVDPLGHVTLTTYDADNRPVHTVDRDGRAITDAYDADGRLLTETWYNADGSVQDVRSYTYDQAGNVLTAASNYGTYTDTYDNAGRLLTQTDPFGLRLTYGYDAAGNVTSLADSLGGQLTSVYDADNRLQSRRFTGQGAQARLDLAYTPASQLAMATRYADMAGTQKIGVSTFSYDAAGNVAEVKHQNGAGTATLADFQYGYDSAERLSSENDNGTVTNYAYDAASQLTTAGAQGYSYDPNGNRTLTGSVTGADNRLASDGTWTYAYDAEGNVVLKTNLGTNETWSYGYDDADHLVSAVHKDGSGNVLAQVAEKYDVFGQRVEEDVTASGTTTVSRFAFDAAGNNWADLNGSSQLLTRRLFDDGGQAYARVSSSGAVAWYLTDRLGSVRAVTDNSGALTDSIAYDAWGNVTSETSPSSGDRFKYAGYQYDAATGLYDVAARWYDPATGRWTSEDPLGFGAGDPNLDRYVGNDPINAIDPTGLYEEDVHFYLTYYLALAVGLGDYKSNYWRGRMPEGSKIFVSEAYIIAWSDAYVDVHSNTEPLRKSGVLTAAAAGSVFGIPGILYWVHVRNSNEAPIRWTYHFRAERGPSDKVVANSPSTYRWVDKGTRDKDPMLTGIGLHAYQDSWAHQGFESYWGHLFAGHAPDWPWKNKDAAMDMAKATYDKLAKYMLDNHNKVPLKSWGDIKDTVSQLLDEFDRKDPENTNYRSDLWYNQTKKDFPKFDGRFESNGDEDAWESWFDKRAKRVYVNGD